MGAPNALFLKPVACRFGSKIDQIVTRKVGFPTTLSNVPRVSIEEIMLATRDSSVEAHCLI